MKVHSLCTSTFKANFDFLQRWTFVVEEFKFTELIYSNNQSKYFKGWENAGKNLSSVNLDD